MITLENLIFLSGKLLILENEGYLAHRLIGSLPGNTVSLYMDAIFMYSIVQLIPVLINFHSFL